MIGVAADVARVPHRPVSGGARRWSVVGVAIAWAMYGRREVPVTAPAGSPVTVAARKDLYGDAINESLLMRPGQWLTRLSVYFDNRGVDGLVNTLAATVRRHVRAGAQDRSTGFVRSYALSDVPRRGAARRRAPSGEDLDRAHFPG